MAASLTLFLSAITGLAVALWAAAQTEPFQLPFIPRQCRDPGPLHGYYASSPYSSSWTSWWSKDRHALSADGASLGTESTGQGGGAIGQDWNVLYHLGGNGPWVEKVDGVFDGGITLPEHCKVEQVHMVSTFLISFDFNTDKLGCKMSRHHERYPTNKAGSSMYIQSLTFAVSTTS